jgi:drug/metabolite transporter (DMT)-like permease
VRPLSLVGIALIVVGAVILIRGGSVTSRRDVLTVGDLKVTATEEQALPPYAGGIALIAGIALVVAGSRKRG